MAIGPWQIAVIVVLVLVLFGASRFADIGKGLGEGIRNFKKGISDDGDGAKEDGDPKQLSASAEQTDESKDSKKTRA